MSAYWVTELYGEVDSESGVANGEYTKQLFFKSLLIASHCSQSVVPCFRILQVCLLHTSPISMLDSLAIGILNASHIKVLLDLCIYHTIPHFDLTLYLLFLLFVKSSLPTFPLYIIWYILHFLQISTSFGKLLCVPKALCSCDSILLLVVCFLIYNHFLSA